MNEGIGVPYTGVQELRGSWGWLLTLGILMIILGIIALADVVSVSLISVFFLGGVLIAAGILEAIQAVRHRGVHRVWLHVLNAVLSIIVGVMLLMYPLSGLLVVTLLMAVYFTVAGIFRIVAAVSTRLPRWGWALTNGIITLILGILIWSHWPISSLWIVGLFIGIDLLILGWSEVMLAFGIRRLAA